MTSQTLADMTPFMPSLAHYLTDFADAGVMVPVCVTVTIALLVMRQRRSAAAWVAVTASVWSVMLALKLGGYLCESVACAVPPPRLGLVSPSGHVAASAAAYGGLVGLMTRSAGRSLPHACFGALIVAVIIGATRVILHEHTIAEVFVGGLVGVSGAVLFTLAAPGWLSVPRRAALFSAVATSILLFHGTHVTWERHIRAISADALQSIGDAR